MKKTITILFFLFLNHIANSQAPLAFNYQAAVYNASGVAMANQLISLRISILNGSATGPVVYSESFNTTTDNTGFFNLSIGTGAVLSGNFNSINWSSGTKWQKTEIDTTGGTTYVLMGTSQYLSVPYALYANQANCTTMEYPDGLDNMIPVLIPANTLYTVPAGKNFYPLHSWGIYYLVNSDTIYTGTYVTGISKSSQVGVSETGTIKAPNTINGFLVDKKVLWVSQDMIANPTYTVPANKIFIVKYEQGNTNGSYSINGLSVGISGGDFFVVDQNQSITFTNTGIGNFTIISGYLKDK